MKIFTVNMKKCIVRLYCLDTVEIIYVNMLNLFLYWITGESGLGKSTLINSLFLTDLYPERIIPGAAGKHTFVRVYLLPMIFGVEWLYLWILVTAGSVS